MVILLEPEVYQDEIVATLVGAGHTVKCLQRHSEEYDFIFGPRACRIPGDPAHLDPAETLRLIGVAVKSMESLKKVQEKHTGVETPIKKKTTKKTVRKKGKKDDTPSGTSTDPCRTGGVEEALEGDHSGAPSEVPEAPVPSYTTTTIG